MVDWNYILLIFRALGFIYKIENIIIYLITDLIINLKRLDNASIIVFSEYHIQVTN